MKFNKLARCQLLYQSNAMLIVVCDNFVNLEEMLPGFLKGCSIAQPDGPGDDEINGGGREKVKIDKNPMPDLSP